MSSVRRKGGGEDLVMRVLVIEDEPGVAGFLKKGLREASYAVDLADNGIDGARRACSGAGRGRRGGR